VRTAIVAAAATVALLIGSPVPVAASPSGRTLQSDRPIIPVPEPANPVDPGIAGPYRTITGVYSLPGVRLSSYPAPVEMRAVVIAPVNAPGRRPLVLFLHGRHWTCYAKRGFTNAWPCPAGSRPLPSYLGFRQAQRLLASQGYVTASISANGINAQDWRDPDSGTRARSALIRMHLAHWAYWASAGRATAPAIIREVPPADLSRVLLVGHSRGGEAISRVATDSIDAPPNDDDYRGRVRWRIRGLVLISPTAFGQNPAPDVPSVTLLSGCDGDVADLEGQLYVDATRGVSRGAALHSALYVIGANHNFANTEWTPGQSADRSAYDDFAFRHDRLCSARTGAGRLTPRQQQTVAATYVAAAAGLFIGGDDRIRPLLDGSGVRAPSADPARVLSSALGAGRVSAIIPGGRLRIRHARLCTEVTDDRAAACLDIGSPNFAAFRAVYPEAGRYAVAMSGSATVALRPARIVSLAGSRALELRLIVPPNTVGNRFTVAIIDAGGQRTRLGTVRVDGLPGTAHTSSYWAQAVRLPLPGGVRTMRTLELTPHSRRPSWLLDAWGWRPGTPPPGSAALARVDIVAGRIVVSGHGPGTIRVFRVGVGPAAAATTSWVLAVRPGRRVRVRGDRRHVIQVKAIRTAMIGDYR
jgi:hypothetical protein